MAFLVALIYGEKTDHQTVEEGWEQLGGWLVPYLAWGRSVTASEL